MIRRPLLNYSKRPKIFIPSKGVIVRSKFISAFDNKPLFIIRSFENLILRYRWVCMIFLTIDKASGKNGIKQVSFERTRKVVWEKIVSLILRVLWWIQNPTTTVSIHSWHTDKWICFTPTTYICAYQDQLKRYHINKTHVPRQIQPVLSHYN